jgi:hypothetical protein
MNTVKLSVTVRRHLERKYDSAARKTINAAVKRWIAADAQRGIKTVHVAVDDAAAMKALGAKALSGKATAAKIKRAIDKLWGLLGADYLVLFGGDEIVPMFVVKNPSFDPGGDDDETVPTDNPYASSAAFRASKRSSYLVPDRTIGRIPDMVDDPSPVWLTDYLTTATSWVSRPASFYDPTYAICCDAWKGAGVKCVQYISAPEAGPMISPPLGNGSTTAKNRLTRRTHMIKCHGAQLDPKFYGQKGSAYPEALTSATLKPKVRSATVPAAMCCYGAQVYSPDDPAAADPGEWPIASTYLRRGALGFAGSTMIAWVGVDQMMCADWIVAGYLKGVLGGASLGRAFLESKQDYVRWINQQGQAPDIADEKTLIEYVLLGDPSIHPVSAVPAAPAKAVAAPMRRAAPALASQERRQRRVVRAQLAAQIRDLLPKRIAATAQAKAQARKVFQAAHAALATRLVKELKSFGIKSTSARVEELQTPLRAPAAAAMGLPGRAKVAALQNRRSLEYYFSGRRVRDGHKEIRLVKVETDPNGNVMRTAVVHSS